MTVTIVINPQINNNGYITQDPHTVSYSTTGSTIMGSPQLIFTTWTQLSSSLPNMSCLYCYNTDTASYISVATDASGNNIVGILSPFTSKAGLFPQTGSVTYYAKSSLSASYLNIIGIPM